MTIFEFTGRFEVDGDVVYAICDHAPLTTEGATRESAFEQMLNAINAYVGTLARRGEMEAGISAGLLKAKSATAGRRTPAVHRDAIPEVIGIKATDHRFVAQAQIETPAA